MTAVEMRRLAGPDLAARHYPLLGMTGAPFGYTVVVDADTILGGDGMYCGVPRSVEVRVGFGERTVFIAKEARGDACLVEAVLAHQLKHVHTDDVALDDFVPELARELRTDIARQSFRPAADAELAKSNVRDVIGENMKRAVDAFNQRRDALHKVLDSPEERAHLRSACGGRGQHLVGRQP